MVRNKEWFKKFEAIYRDSTERVGSYFVVEGNDRLRGYRVLSELERMQSRLWSVMRNEEEEDILEWD